MTVRSIGHLTAQLHDAIAPAGTRKMKRTEQPVRRNSYNIGDRERQVWRPIGDGTSRGARRWIAAMMQAAEKYDRMKKAQGKRNGPLGHVGIEVLRELLRLVDYKTGALFPSIETIARNTRRARAAVVAALKRLKDHGFLTWIRRTEPTENAGGYGPQVRQISNAYGFDVKMLPKYAADLVRRLMSAGAPPDDDTHRRTQAAADHESMLSSLPLSEQGSARVSDPELAAALNGLGAALCNANSPGGQNPGSEG
jgi:hypothetical protein